MCVTQSPSITKHSGSKLVDDIETAFGKLHLATHWVFWQGHLERGLEYDKELKKTLWNKKLASSASFFHYFSHTHLAVFSGGFLLQ